MSNSSTAKSGGIGFLGALAILFIGLKLTHFITWSWWLVLLPLYPAAFCLALILIGLLLVLIAKAFG